MPDTVRFPWQTRGLLMKIGNRSCARRSTPISSCFLKQRCRKVLLRPFRMIRLKGKRVLWTALPVKAAPGDPPLKRDERDLKVDSLRRLKALGEKYYDQMYESRHGVTGLYSNTKDVFNDAISLANELGMKEEAEALSKRLDHIKAVFRSQFS